MCDSGKWECFCEGNKKARSARKISRCAPHDGMGGMGLFHVVYNGYVYKTLFPYRHPERSGGIFPAHWYSAVCGIAEKGKPLAKGARNDGVQGRFLAAPLMTVWGNGFIPRSVQRICLESAIPVSSSRAKPSIFPAHWYSALCETAENGKPSAKGARKSRVQGRFLAAPLMTVWGNGFISRSVQRICWENATSATSSRAKSRDLSCRRG